MRCQGCGEEITAHGFHVSTGLTGCVPENNKTTIMVQSDGPEAADYHARIAAFMSWWEEACPGLTGVEATAVYPGKVPLPPHTPDQMLEMLRKVAEGGGWKVAIGTTFTENGYSQVNVCVEMWEPDKANGPGAHS